MAPRVRKSKGAVVPSSSLVASSARFSGNVTPIYQPAQAWQLECYRHFHICPEARAAARFFGRAMARATLGVANVTGEGSTPITSGPVYEDLMALFSGPQGQEQMLEDIGVHLSIAGECYLIGRQVDVEGNPIEDGSTGGIDLWEILSIKEVSKSGTNWQIDYGEGTRKLTLGEEDTVIRIWLPSPDRRLEADSPFRSLLPVLTEVEWFTKHIAAQIQSRLAGAGILFLPQEMTFPDPPPIEGKEQTLSDNQAVRFMQTLGHHMLTPISDPSSPAALIPIVVTAPGEVIDKIKLLTFWSPLDENAMPMRKDALIRFATGMDLPPEMVLGMGSNGGTGGGRSNGVSHWGAWQIEESTIKMYIEPMLDLVLQALTISYLRVLSGGPQDRVTADTSRLRLRPDRSKESMELWRAGKLKTTKMLEENGFDEGDMPDDAERKQWLLEKQATGSATPDMVLAALKELGVDLHLPSLPRETQPAMPELPPAPSIADHPERPRTPDPQSAALLAACEGIVLQGLQRAGNRMRGKGAQTAGDCPAYAVHTMVSINGKADEALKDAFPMAEIVLQGIADHTSVVPVLEAYCKGLFASQEPHTREKLQKYLEAGVTS